MLTTDSRAGRISIWISAVLIAILLNVTCNPAAASEVERAKTVSVESKKHSTIKIVCVETTSGKRYSVKYNTHCYCKNYSIPENWTVITRGKKSFIKAEL